MIPIFVIIIDINFWRGYDLYIVFSPWLSMSLELSVLVRIQVRFRYWNKFPLFHFSEKSVLIVDRSQCPISMFKSDRYNLNCSSLNVHLLPDVYIPYVWSVPCAKLLSFGDSPFVQHRALSTNYFIDYILSFTVHCNKIERRIGLEIRRSRVQFPAEEIFL